LANPANLVDVRMWLPHGTVVVTDKGSPADREFVCGQPHQHLGVDIIHTPIMAHPSPLGTSAELLMEQVRRFGDPS
jgi:hypothetical protein